ncbi:Anti-sigma-E factor ChrR [Roseivivax sp. THAF40]|uniref:ChrR family anti-sigma-E factor n=1 Tax=unclassified Roseivivax TaxID=2639302 RepID=UPI001267FFFB|nr:MULTISPECIES: ChrR family anti-sigma-E factor [unclassified Roseivivax]QFS81278.1 Anti-sigma-E factor ChrR [Roseivivax sp. THAF197b]QFT45007.1 Anti-sigma-E factor ChrR [Roseivivax sp. THAF40]
MIHHHLPDDMLMAYAAGQLPEAFALAVATHLSLCDTCRAAAESFDALGGALLDEAETVAVSDDLLARTMAGLNMDADAAVSAPPRDPVLPQPLLGYVGGRLADVKWRSVGRGVKQAILPMTDDTATARLLYIPAGTAVPDHSHHGTEITVVLQGAFTDEDGRFARGDVEVASDEVDHTPVADISEDCICLAVTDAPLRFKGWLPRIAQPFLRI